MQDRPSASAVRMHTFVEQRGVGFALQMTLTLLAWYLSQYDSKQGGRGIKFYTDCISENRYKLAVHGQSTSREQNFVPST